MADLLELEIDGAAAGGACVARHDGRVVFVRHALPGERVRAAVTEDRGGSFLRADAVEILRPAPERVEPPCPHAGPGRCGGCDWQHASADAQLAMKSAVIRDQFARVGKLELAPEVFGGVEALPGGLLGWRTRITWAVGPAGRTGLRRHGSHDLEPVDLCPLGLPDVATAPAGEWPGRTAVEVVRGDDGLLTVLEHRPGPGRQARGRRPPDRLEVADGPPTVVHHLGAREFVTAPGGFWQVHPAAADTLADAVLTALAPRPGERVLDLYAGAGALTAVLADAVGPVGEVLGVESDAQAVRDAEVNLTALPHARVVRARLGRDPLPEGFAPDLVVLDPPRAGAGREVVAAISAIAARAVGYVSCDPATLARDVADLRAHGWQLTALRAFDAFPMTQHVECVATLRPGADATPGSAGPPDAPHDRP